MQFRAPDPALAELVLDCGFEDSGPAGSGARRNDHLPGPAYLTFDAGPLRARIRSHGHEWRDEAVVFGPTSHAFRVDSDGGRMMGVAATPFGWARLFGKHAARAADRVVPLAAPWGEERPAELHRRLATARRDEEAARRILDAALTPSRRACRRAAVPLQRPAPGPDPARRGQSRGATRFAPPTA